MDANKRFFEVRDSLGLSQSEIGKLLNVSYVTIGNWEKGEPKLSGNQYIVLQIIGIEPKYVISGNTEMLMDGVTITDARRKARKLLEAANDKS